MIFRTLEQLEQLYPSIALRSQSMKPPSQQQQQQQQQIRTSIPSIKQGGGAVSNVDNTDHHAGGGGIDASNDTVAHGRDHAIGVDIPKLTINNNNKNNGSNSTRLNEPSSLSRIFAEGDSRSPGGIGSSEKGSESINSSINEINRPTGVELSTGRIGVENQPLPTGTPAGPVLSPLNILVVDDRSVTKQSPLIPVAHPRNHSSQYTGG